MDLHEANRTSLQTFLAVLCKAHRRLGGDHPSPSLSAGSDGRGDGLPDYSRFPSVVRAAEPPHVDGGFDPSYDDDLEPPYDEDDDGDGILDDDDDDEDEEGGGEGGEGGGVILEYDEAYRNGGFGGVPAAAAAVANLEKHKYHEAGSTTTTGDEATAANLKNLKCHEAGSTTTGDEAAARGAAAGCIICMEDFEAGDDLGVMPCSHRFHEGCLVQWLARSRLCPCCRHALPSEAQHQQA